MAWLTFPLYFCHHLKKCCLVVVYNLFIRLYFLAARVAALWNRKARAWIRGRKGLFEELERKIPAGDPIIWVHCSSAGEFEQGKPLIEQLKKEYPSYKILVSFFFCTDIILPHNIQQIHDAVT